MSTNDLPAFLAQLTVHSRSAPARQSGDPTENGYNIWPKDASTFVPGNDQYGGFKRAWHGDPVPMGMLSCASSVGDWLHVELWNLDADTVLIKLYTDWN